MESEMSPRPRSKVPLRRLLAAALSGGLGVFGLAVDSNTAGQPAPGSASPAANVAPADPQGD